MSETQRIGGSGATPSSFPATVDDDVLLALLATPAHGSFHDPGDLIPDRWRRKDPMQRCAMFVDVFAGVLEVVTGRQPRLLVVVEPGVAALVFYGVLRMLPSGELREAIRFSTFEPKPDESDVPLAATWFDSEPAALQFDVKRVPGLAINTVFDGPYQIQCPKAPYARRLLKRLLDGGFAAVDRMLANVRAAGAKTVADLNRLGAVDRLATTLFDPDRPLTPDDWRKMPIMVDYLSRAVVEAIGRIENPAAELHPLVGHPQHLLLLELIAPLADQPDVRPAVEYLLAHLSEEQMPQLAALPGVPVAWKVGVLARYAALHGKLPPGCEQLWDESARLVAENHHDQAVAVSLLVKLEPSTRKRLCDSVAPEQADAMLVSLSAACRHHGVPWAALDEAVEDIDAEILVSLHQSYDAEFFRRYPPNKTALGDKVRALLDSLPDHADDFAERYELLEAADPLLTAASDREALAAWGRCREAILEVGRLQGRRRATVEMDDAARQMAEAVVEAMPEQQVSDDEQGSRKQWRLRAMGRSLLGTELLPEGVARHDAVWQKVVWYFTVGSWRTETPAAPRSERISRPVLWTAGAIAAILLLVIVGSQWFGPTEPPLDGSARADAGDVPPGRPASTPDDTPAPDEVEAAESAADELPVEQPPPAPAPPAVPPEELPAEEATSLPEATTPPPDDDGEPAEPPSDDLPPRVFPPEEPAAPTKVEPPTEPKHAQQPAVPTIAATPGVAQVEGALQIEEDASAFDMQSDIAHIALLEVQAIPEGGGRFPRWFREDYEVRCTGLAHLDDGTVQKLPTTGISRPKEFRLLTGTVKVELRFEFWPIRNTMAALGKGPTHEAETPWHTIEPIVPGTEYHVMFQLPKDQLFALRGGKGVLK